ncbi:MAG TPA: PrsW family glutamic-type intramembrane protease [Chthonomonadaceae bacterium]|nr:PrsW family glutamic-type intramembrane protease [Chthonomonadaceae bacterium]
MNNQNPLKIETIFPLHIWLKDAPWNHVWVRWFLAYALLPLTLVQFVTSNTSDTAFGASFFGLYFAILWLLVLYLSMAPGRPDVLLLSQIALFTAFVGVVIVVVLQQAPPFNILYAGTQAQGELALLPRMLGFILGVGVVEETTKALPIWIFCYNRNYPASPLMYSFIGAVSGLAFGVAEAVHYSYLYANGLTHGRYGVSVYMIAEFLRLISLPLLHACWSAVVGYFIGLARLYRGPAKSLIAFGIIVAAILHGLYDTLSGSWAGLAVAAVSLIVFVSYVRTSALISKQLESQYLSPTENML